MANFHLQIEIHFDQAFFWKPSDEKYMKYRFYSLAFVNIAGGIYNQANV